MTPLNQSVLEAVREAVGPGPCVLHEPRFDGNESEYLQECLDTTFVSSVGPFVDRFENDLAKYTGAKHVVATVNGTAALHVALLLAGVEPADEVLVPTLSFVATANAVRYCRAVPHFVDSDERTLGMDPVALRAWLQESTDMHSGFTVNRLSGRRIRAVVPMHTFGHPTNLTDLLTTAADFNIVVVEDAAESLGSMYQGQHTGTFGLLGSLSFNGNKTITTGGGGAILTNDPELARRAKHLTTTAKVPHGWDYVHDEVGFNYRMPNVNAALGCAQLEQLPGFLASKRRLLGRYLEAFSGLSGAHIFEEPQGCTSNYWLQTLLLERADMVQRNSILKETNESGFMTRPAWTLLHRLPPFADCPRAPLPIAEILERRIISLPSSAGLA
ncbi:MAG: GDP-perosamine synthase [Nitrospira sp.]|nr:GDP-perosamine synthase [Nitrospira sp.]